MHSGDRDTPAFLSHGEKCSDLGVDYRVAGVEVVGMDGASGHMDSGSPGTATSSLTMVWAAAPVALFSACFGGLVFSLPVSL